MAPNILITGAAGYMYGLYLRVFVNYWLLYSGGSLVADFVASKKIDRKNITATVRSEEQAKILSKLGINVLQLDLADEKAVVENVLAHNSTKFRRAIYINT
jgi:hypothetical protein